ncbi:carboxypeptidase, partial [Vibrio anguillarum]
MHRFALSASYITNQTDGSFGYFPSYTLGAMYAAQFMAAMKKTVDV